LEESCPRDDLPGGTQMGSCLTQRRTGKRATKWTCKTASSANYPFDTSSHFQLLTWFQGLQHLLGFCGFLLSSIDHREYLMSSPIGFMERQELAEGYRVRAVRGNHKAVNRHWRDVRSEVKNLQPNCRLHQFHRTLKVTSFEHPGCPTIDDLMNTV